MKEIISVQNLTKYYGSFKAVDDISFRVNEGELFAFLGENGAGKSTSINVLCTILSKSEGSIIIDGYDLDKQPDAIRNIIGIVFQGSVLDSFLTVKQNLETRCSYYGMSKKERTQKIKELSHLLELHDILLKKYGNLSGGQRRRADIARALISNPRILFLDEPTTGLDPKTRQNVWKLINTLRKERGLTVFLTTHYMEETEEADKIVILDHGRIVAQGTPNSLKNRFSSNKMIWHSQKDEDNDILLKKYNLDFRYHNNAYIIHYRSNEDLINFLYEQRQRLKDYELIKGNMDDVFLNVTGKDLYL